MKTSNTTRFHKVLRKTLKGIAYFVCALIIYICATLIGAFIEVGGDDLAIGSDSVEIAVRTNGVHTDIVLPIRTSTFDFNAYLPASAFKAPINEYNYASFGWGDKGFYLNTPEWSDLTFSTAFKAAFGLSGSAMHVTLEQSLPKDTVDARVIRISKANYVFLARFITESYRLDGANSAIIIPNAAYGEDDAFFEANGRYAFFYSCNVWTGCALKKAHVPTALWSLCDFGIMRNLPERKTKK